MKFENENYFLSNFFEKPIIVKIGDQELLFRNVEAAYHAHKNKEISDKFCLLTAYQAKKYGMKIPLDVSINQWKNNDRYYVMAKLLWLKFQDPYLFAKLKSIKGEIIHDNYWNDIFWGVCKNKGFNILGQLLMCLRDNGNDENGLYKINELCDLLKVKYREEI